MAVKGLANRTSAPQKYEKNPLPDLRDGDRRYEKWEFRVGCAADGRQFRCWTAVHVFVSVSQYRDGSADSNYVCICHAYGTQVWSLSVSWNKQKWIIVVIIILSLLLSQHVEIKIWIELDHCRYIMIKSLALLRTLSRHGKVSGLIICFSLTSFSFLVHFCVEHFC